MGRKLWKSLKSKEGQEVEFRPHLNFLTLFLDFGVVLHDVPVSSEQLGISLAQMMLASRPGLI